MAASSHYNNSNSNSNNNESSIDVASQLDLEPGARLLSFNGRTAEVVRAKVFQGVELVDVRKMFVLRDDNGDYVRNADTGRIRLIFTKKGISIKRENLGKLIGILREINKPALPPLFRQNAISGKD